MNEREDLFQKIQATFAGHSEREVIGTLLASLVVAIGVSADNLKAAEMIIDGLPAKMKPAVRDNWDSYRKHRATVDFREKFERGIASH